MSPEQISELVRRGEYEVDCAAVAEAILSRLALVGRAIGSEDVLVPRERVLRTVEPHA